MNIQSGRARNLRPHSSGSGNIQVQLLPKLWFVTKIVLFMVGVAVIFNMHIYLRQRVMETERNIRSTERDINNTRRELEQLRADYAENTSWEHIRERIIAFRLPLRPPANGQVRRIRIYTPEQGAQIAAMLDRRSNIAARR